MRARSTDVDDDIDGRDGASIVAMSRAHARLDVERGRAIGSYAIGSDRIEGLDLNRDGAIERSAGK